MIFAAYKEPKGMIKLLELLMTIIAFSLVCGFTTTFSYSVFCKEKNVTGSYELKIDYPFDLYNADQEICDKGAQNFDISYSSQSEFFVTVGVLSFIYCICCGSMYLFYYWQYLENDLLTKADFVTTVVLSFFWLVAACVWVDAVSSMKDSTTGDLLLQRLEPCKTTPTYCIAQSQPVFGKLNASIIAGFASLLLWLSNLWFLRRDTPWFKKYYDMEEIQSLPPTPATA